MSTVYTKVGDGVTNFSPVGLELFLISEDGRLITGEDTENYLVTSLFNTYTKITDITTVYTEEGDMSTSYTKVTDATTTYLKVDDI